MAFSQPLSGSVRKGQAALMCQLCENDQKLKWKCEECRLLMCQRCRDKVHPKFPSAENHTIIDIKEIRKQSTDSEPKPDLTKIKCEKHDEKSCCMYCKTCGCPVCQTCIANTHIKHKFKEISHEYKKKIAKAKRRQRKLKSEIQSLITGQQRLRQISLHEQSKYEKVKQEILDYDKALVNEIKEHTNKLIQDLDQKREAVSKHIDTELKRLKKEQSEIEKQMLKMNDLLEQGNTQDLFSFSDSSLMSQKIDVKSSNALFQGVPKFVHGDKEKISLILGKMEDVGIQIDCKCQVEATFETDLEDISTVVSIPDGSLWICDSEEMIQKVKPKSDNLNIISSVEKRVYDAALFPSGDLLLSVTRSSNLKLIPSGSSDIQKSVYTARPLKTKGVHVTCDNKVIVGVVDTDDIPATGPRLVTVMGQTGHHEKVFQYDRHNKPLFSYPYRITSNSQGNIAVIDMVSDDFKGRVVVLDQEGGVRNIYTGHPDVNNEDNPFQPTGITTTPSDNFVVADQDNHILHILNREGEFITFYNTEEMGIELPWSLSFSTTGQLYIGCGTYTDSEENAKLYKVDNFIF